MRKFSTKMLLLKHPMETHTLRPSFYRQKVFCCGAPKHCSGRRGRLCAVFWRLVFMTVPAPELSEKSRSSCKYVIAFLALAAPASTRQFAPEYKYIGANYVKIFMTTCPLNPPCHQLQPDTAAAQLLWRSCTHSTRRDRSPLKAWTGMQRSRL